VFDSIIAIACLQRRNGPHGVSRRVSIKYCLQSDTDTDTDSFIRNRKAKVNTI